MYWRFVEWTDAVCDRCIPKGGWNLALQCGVMGSFLGLALLLRGVL
jgi:hypothetical protein